MSRKLRVASLVATVALAGAARAPAQSPSFPDVSIAGSKLECRVVAVVAGLYEYRYTVLNPGTSSAGVASVAVDGSAPLTLRPPMLTTRGFFLGDGTIQAVDATSGHVPLGMDVPPDWGGTIAPTGFVEWYGRGEGLTVRRPVVPGVESSEFLLRSTYLPGIRGYRLLPEYPHLCCPFPAGDPRNDTVQVKSAFDFRSEGASIGPTYEPTTVTIALVRGLRSQACELGWITKAGVCHSLEVKLDDAAAAIAENNVERARNRLRALLSELDAQRGAEPAKSITENAYWLLKANVEALLSRL